MDRYFEESDRLAAELQAIADELELTNDSERIRVAAAACTLSLEHWHAARTLLLVAFVPSALIVHRAQFEAITRSVWLTYAATDENIAKFAGDLNLSTEQIAKNSPGVDKMMQQIEAKAPKPAHDALLRFKDNSWCALNSYAHAGIHPLNRQQEGYPAGLVHSVLCNTNGLAVISYMQAAVLGGEQPLQRQILEVAGRYPDCMPSRLV